MSRLLLVLLLVSAAAFGADDKAYKVVGPHGTVEFSDQPQPGATEIKVPPAQTYQAPVLPKNGGTPPSTAADHGKSSTTSYTALSISSPTPDQTFHGSNGTVPVQVTLEPSLRSGDSIVIMLDGGTAAKGVGNHFVLRNVERGTHTLVAQIQDAKGQVLRSSGSVTFHMFQFSKLFKKNSQ